MSKTTEQKPPRGLKDLSRREQTEVAVETAADPASIFMFNLGNTYVITRPRPCNPLMSMDHTHKACDDVRVKASSQKLNALYKKQPPLPQGGGNYSHSD